MRILLTTMNKRGEFVSVYCRCSFNLNVCKYITIILRTVQNNLAFYTKKFNI